MGAPDHQVPIPAAAVVGVDSSAKVAQSPVLPLICEESFSAEEQKEIDACIEQCKRVAEVTTDTLAQSMYTNGLVRADMGVSAKQRVLKAVGESVVERLRERLQIPKPTTDQNVGRGPATVQALVADAGAQDLVAAGQRFQAAVTKFQAETTECLRNINVVGGTQEERNHQIKGPTIAVEKILKQVRSSFLPAKSGAPSRAASYASSVTSVKSDVGKSKPKGTGMPASKGNERFSAIRRTVAMVNVASSDRNFGGTDGSVFWARQACDGHWQ